MLKKIIIAELDAKTDVDTELINASIDAILSTKYEPIFKHVDKEELAKSSEELCNFILSCIDEK